MKNMNELRQHLHAVEQTRQITNAMYLLSTSRMKKAVQNIDYNLTYMRRLRATMKDILSKTKRNALTNKYIELHEDGKVLFVVITSDKGLCGGYNAGVMDLALKTMARFHNPLLVSLGVMGTESFENRGIKPDFVHYGASQHPSLFFARHIAEQLVAAYDEHRVSEVYVVYTEYRNSATHPPVCERILPLLRRDYFDVEYEYQYTAEPIYEPSVEEVFAHTVPQYIIGLLYDILMQSSASENAARMTAMQSATKNADKMIDKLAREINAVRQLSITNEITEIAAATEIAGGV